jgi:hypothetical protein
MAAAAVVIYIHSPEMACAGQSKSSHIQRAAAITVQLNRTGMRSSDISTQGLSIIYCDA